MTKPEHHQHIRKRIYKKLEVYPSPDPLKRFMDNFIYLIGVLGPLLTIPQVFKIWIAQDASGVSLITWGSYFIFSIFWIIYGVIHEEKPIILSSFLSLIVQAGVVIGIIFFR